MKRFLSHGFLASLLLLAACGNITVDPGGSGQGGASSSSTSTSGTSSSSGTGGVPACGATSDSFRFTLETWDGQVIDCASAQPGGTQNFSLQGAITQLSNGSFQIDSCSPAADCVPLLSTLSIDSPGFAAQMTNGSFVDVSVQIDYPFGCSQTLLVRNLPEWDGFPSTGGPLPRLWLAGSEGSTATLDGSPFTIESIPLGCYPKEEPPGCGVHDDYALRFHQTAAPGDPGLLLGMGDTSLWEVTDQGSPALWFVRNLKSFETGNCDDYWNWAYWVVFTYPPD